MATLDDIKIAKQRWSRSLPEDLMEKSQSEPGCGVRCGGGARRDQEGGRSRWCCLLSSPEPAGASGQAPFDSLLWTAGGGGHCSLPDVSGAMSSHPGD